MYILGRYLSIYVYTELTNDSDFAYLTAQIDILCTYYLLSSSTRKHHCRRMLLPELSSMYLYDGNRLIIDITQLTHKP